MAHCAELDYEHNRHHGRTRKNGLKELLADGHLRDATIRCFGTVVMRQEQEADSDAAGVLNGRVGKRCPESGSSSNSSVAV